MIKRKMLASTSPDIVITVNGNNVKIDTITSVKTLNLEFTLDTPYKTDPGNYNVKDYFQKICTLCYLHTLSKDNIDYLQTTETQNTSEAKILFFFFCHRRAW